jgi:predicted nicotinamide N-methyase
LEEKIPDTLTPSRIRELIQSSFPLTPVPNVPEIRLHKAGPGSGLWRFAEADKDFDAPYWAYHWGGGLALARHVLDNPQSVAGRKVLDLGAGSGIVAIAAAKAGAAYVTAADINHYAIEAIDLNAAANGVNITPLLADLTPGSPPEVDIVLVGDLFYDADLAQRVTAFLDRCLAANIQILVGDPWRATLPLSRLTLLAEYEGGDFGASDNAPQKKNAVFAFKPA